jgi:hypothetical protein
LIIDCNRNIFSQAQDSPFKKEILGMILFSGTGPITDSILKGTITVNKPIIQLVLENLKRPANL